jgi:uncharacterized repeat protein (TIGR03803 family)
VFKLDPAGNLTTLLEFTRGRVLVYTAGLLRIEDRLLGATAAGDRDRAGFVFDVDTNTGEQQVLYSFTGATDGAYPKAGLIADGAGNLYGTTNDGGSAVGPLGYGVVFQLNLATRQETVLRTFDGSDGAYPSASLIRDSAGNLYGDTSGGPLIGGGNSGNGTVVKLDPGPAASITNPPSGRAPSDPPVKA